MLWYFSPDVLTEDLIMNGSLGQGSLELPVSSAQLLSIDVDLAPEKGSGARW